MFMGMMGILPTMGGWYQSIHGMENGIIQVYKLITMPKTKQVVMISLKHKHILQWKSEMQQWNHANGYTLRIRSKVIWSKKTHKDEWNYMDQSWIIHQMVTYIKTRIKF